MILCRRAADKLASTITLPRVRSVRMNSNVNVRTDSRSRKPTMVNFIERFSSTHSSSRTRISAWRARFPWLFQRLQGHSRLTNGEPVRKNSRLMHLCRRGPLVAQLDASELKLMEKAISRDPEVMHGTPVFRGTRVPVQTLFEYLEGGETLEDFLEGFPTVNRELAIQALEEAKHLLLSRV